MSFLSTRILLVWLIAVATYAAPPAAQPETLSWVELAAHAGLAGLAKPNVFKVDRVNDLGSILLIQAEIELSDENWRILSREDELSLLRPWKSGSITAPDWKATVDLTLPEKRKFDVEHLRFDAPAVVLHRDNPRSVRIYLLVERPRDKQKCLYYFYTRD
jgi:hypothetical protein